MLYRCLNTISSVLLRTFLKSSLWPGFEQMCDKSQIRQRHVADFSAHSLFKAWSYGIMPEKEVLKPVNI